MNAFSPHDFLPGAPAALQHVLRGRARAAMDQALVPFGRWLLMQALSARDRALGYPPPKIPDSPLDALEQALVSAAADAFFALGGPIPISGTEAGLLEYFDAYLRRSVGQTRVLIHLLLLFMELSPLLFGPRAARFTDLAPAERVRFLEGMASSRLYFRRLAFTSIRTLMSMGYLANAHVTEHMGMVPNTNPFGLDNVQEAP